MIVSTKSILAGLLVFQLLPFIIPRAVSGDDKKVTVEQIIAGHLDSIGTAEARSNVKSRFVSGSVKLISRLGNSGQLLGKGAIASATPKVRYTMKFSALDFPSEEMVFDGDKTATSFLPQGKRSNLSQFLDQHTLPLREGLICGTLSTSWALFRIEDQKPKLEYKGMAKINGKQVHRVFYRQRKGSPDLKVSLYFDPQTFRHVRTEYQFQIGARLGVGPNDSNAVQESFYTLTEDFDDFRPVDSLTLPHSYKLTLSISASNGTLLYDYQLSAEQISHKETFTDQTFKLN
jgi:hypothetical protein